MQLTPSSGTSARLPALLGAMAFLVLALSVLLRTSPDYLTADEVYYYFQARGLRHGELLWFSDTSSFLMPLWLALLPAGGVTLSRLLNAAFVGGGVYFCARLLARRIEKRLVIFSVLLFLFNSEVLFVGSLALAEPIQLCFLFWFLDELLSDRCKPRAIFPGLLLGLSVLAKLSGLAAVPFVILQSLLNRSRESLRRGLIVAAIAVAMPLPFLSLTGFHFLVEKAGGEASFPKHAWAVLTSLHGSLGLLAAPVLALCVASPFVLPRERTGFPATAYAFVGAFLAAVLASRSYVYTRYFVGIAPFLYALAGLALVTLERRRRVSSLVLAAAAALAIGAQAFDWARPPTVYNRYYLRYPKERCQEIATLSLKDTGRLVNLPYFSIPSDSDQWFTTRFRLQPQHRSFIFSYVSDTLLLVVHDRNAVVLESDLAVAWERSQVIRIPERIESREYSVDLRIHNNVNIGGIGQILVCDEEFTARVLRSLPPPGTI